MFYDKDPPKESVQFEFPSLDQVVTVENCWYYLSLLERFVDITKDMNEEDLKLYLVRAEYRYFRWIAQPSGTSKSTAPPPPPPPVGNIRCR